MLTPAIKHKNKPCKLCTFLFFLFSLGASYSAHAQFEAQIAQLCDGGSPNEGTILYVTATGAPSGSWSLEIRQGAPGTSGNPMDILGGGSNGDLIEVTGVAIGTQIEVVDGMNVATVINASNATFLDVEDDDDMVEGDEVLGCQNELTCSGGIFDLIEQNLAGSYSSSNPGGIIGSNSLAGPHSGNFNAVILGDFTSDGTGDSEGRLAVQNDFTASGNYTIGGANPSSTGALHTPQGWDNLVAGGDVNHSAAFSGVRGNLLYNTATDLPPFSGGYSQIPGIYRQATPDVNWTSVKSYFQNVAASLASCSGDATINIDITPSGFFETVDLANNTGVVVVNFDEWDDNTTINFVNWTNAAAIIINVPGTDIDMASGLTFQLDGSTVVTPMTGSEIDFIEKTIWNFYQATSYDHNLLTFPGSVLAPNIGSMNTVTLSGGSINGQAVFGGDVSQSGSFEFHNFCFRADISSCISISCSPPSITDCDAAVSDFTDFDGSGFSPNPGTGQLCSNAFVVEGLSDGNGTLGGTHTSGDFARGNSNTPGVTTGGVYAVDNGGNPALWLQPTGGDLTSGTITTVVCNNSGSTINDLLIGYDLLYYNDQGRANRFNFSYNTGPSGSIPMSSFTSVNALDFTTPEAADASPTIQTVPLQTVLTGINLADGDCIYLRWTTDDVSGSGSRDELGLDNIFVASAEGCYALGNRVFSDNGGAAPTPTSPDFNDGEFDTTAGEVGIDGVNVTLYLDPDGDGDLSNAQIIGTDITANGGYYIFTNLVPTFGNRRYVVGIDPANFDPGGALENLASSTPTGNNATTDNDDNGQNTINPTYGVTTQPIMLSGAQPVNETDKEPSVGDGGVDDDKSNLTYDFGFYTIPVSLGSTVFADLNNNGLQDMGETGIANVVVNLNYDSNADGDFLDAGEMSFRTTTTNGSGDYFFDNLPPGDYQVVIPVGEFGTGEPLENLQNSSTPTDANDNQEDGDDNGTQSGGAGTEVVSPTITLTNDGEPINANEGGQGGNQDNADDNNGDMTVDFGFFVGFDFGDLGSNYPQPKATILGGDANSDGIPDGANAVWAGTIVDAEATQNFSMDALEDDGDKDDDEDGLSNLPAEIFTGQTYELSIVLNSNQNGTNMYYGLWFDWNGDGDFDDADDAFFSNTTAISYNGSSVDALVSFTVPTSAVENYAVRLIVSDMAINSTDVGAMFTNGEIEDYIEPTELPVELLNFTATPMDNGRVLLKWSTATETNNAYFSIQRSENGIYWQEIGQVKGAGHSLETQNYTHWDMTPSPGINYYRLQQFDFDGQFEYHKVITAKINDAKPLSVNLYPNPTGQNLNIEISGNHSRDYRLEMYNATGQAVPIALPTITSGQSIQTINVSELRAGLYFVKIMDQLGQVLKVATFTKWD